MKCARCLVEIPEDGDFCPGCGLKVRREAVPSSPPTRPQPQTATPKPTADAQRVAPTQPIPPQQEAGPPPPATDGWGDAVADGQYSGPPSRDAPPIQQPPPGAAPYAAPGDAFATQPPRYAPTVGEDAAPPAGYDYPGPSYTEGGEAPPRISGYPVASAGVPGKGNVDRDSMLLVLGILYVGLLALISIVMILFKGVSGSGYKALGVLYSIGIYSAIAVCGYVHIRRHTYEAVGITVIVAAAVAAFFSIIGIFSSSENLLKFTSVVALIALLGAVTALLLLMNSDKEWFRYSQYSAIALIWVTGLLLVATEFQSSSVSISSSGSFDSSTVLIKAIGVFAVLAISASIISILLWRLALRFEGKV